MASKTTSTYAQLTSREIWHTWLSSITDLALNYDVWKYVDPEWIEEVPKPITDDTTHTGLQKINEHISSTVSQEFQIIYAGYL
jgi:hypothetical protein